MPSPLGPDRFAQKPGRGLAVGVDRRCGSRHTDGMKGSGDAEKRPTLTPEAATAALIALHRRKSAAGLLGRAERMEPHPNILEADLTAGVKLREWMLTSNRPASSRKEFLDYEAPYVAAFLEKQPHYSWYVSSVKNAATLIATHFPEYYDTTHAAFVIIDNSNDAEEAGGRASSLSFLFGAESELGATIVLPYSYTPGTLPPEPADIRQALMGEPETVEDYASRKGLTVAQLDEAADKWITAQGEVTARETTARAPEPPRLKGEKERLNEENRRGDFAGAATETAKPERLRFVTAKELDKVPPGLRVKQHQKYEFAPEELADPGRVKSERSIANARNYKLRKGVALSDDEDERGRVAEAFIQQARTRRSHQHLNEG